MVCWGKKSELLTIMVIIKRVSTISELEGIKQLQQDNLKANLSPGESETEGFVTAEYSMDFLQKMHQAGASIIAKDGELVVGYALVAHPSIRHEHELLDDLFNAIDQTQWQGKLLQESKYVVVGQLCVSKFYRGMGLVNRMYDYYKECLSGEFDYCLTDIVQNNQRSLKAHRKAGFQVVNTLDYGGSMWDIVLWQWTKIDERPESGD
jgi:ribosomal protein S18 acetylase RimI-like enzyme